MKKLLKFNEWTSWRDDLYDEEIENPDKEHENQNKEKRFKL